LWLDLTSLATLSLSTLTETGGVGEATAGWLEKREARESETASKLMAARPAVAVGGEVS